MRAHMELTALSETELGQIKAIFLESLFPY